MKNLIFFFYIYSSTLIFGQTDGIPRNIFSMGSGANNRGLIGVEHSVNFLPKKKMFFSLESSIGITRDYALGIYSLAPAINLGKNGQYFTCGIENKYMHDTYHTVIENAYGYPLPSSYRYRGYVIAPFLGYNLIGTNWFNLKIRLSLNIFTKNYAHNITEHHLTVRPGIGIFMGLFKKREN